MTGRRSSEIGWLWRPGSATPAPVIPGRAHLGASPESILPIVVMDSGLATSSRPGMTDVKGMIAMAIAKRVSAPDSVPNLAAHVGALDWPQITAELDSQGCAVLKNLLTPDQDRKSVV